MHKKEDLLEKAIIVLNKNPTLGFAEICKEMNVARATVYKNFSDKQDLLEQLVGYWLDILEKILVDINAWDSTNSEKINIFIEKKVEMIEQFYFLYTFQNLVHKQEIYIRYCDLYWIIKVWINEIASNSSDSALNWNLYVLDGLFYSWWYALKDNMLTKEELVLNIKESFKKELQN